MTTRMHADEVEIDAALVRRLLAAQLPAWSSLPLARVESTGTDNAMFRLGDDLAVRLPRIPRVAGQTAKEQRWLPVLAPRLPVAVPLPVGLGVPGEGFPFPWSVCRWVPGSHPDRGDVRLARELAAFVLALRAVDAAGAPPPGPHNFGRGRPLAERDEWVRPAIAALGSSIDAAAVTAAWERALRAPVHDGPPAWLHGDLQRGNVLAGADGGLGGVIDFGGLAAGDPAVDLLPAWNLFTGAAREEYRAALSADDAAWERGRGWALSVALISLPYYRDTNPRIVRDSWHVVGEVLADIDVSPRGA